MTHQIYTTDLPKATPETLQIQDETGDEGTLAQKGKGYRAPKIPTLRIQLGYLYQRTIREAALRGQDSNALALSVVMGASGLHNPLLNGGVDLVPGDQIHPRGPLMIVSGSLIGMVQAAAKKHNTCASRYIRWRLSLALEEPYQRSVFEVI